MLPRTLVRSMIPVLVIASALVVTGCAVYSAPPPGPPVRTAPPPPPPPPAPRLDRDIGFFYDSLSPYGDWLWVDPYGWVWAPDRVAPFWRPYTVGRWVWTDWGWTWDSDESWGWATYHYGRWKRVPRYGWIWVPGTVWGPAWVAWREGPGLVGWAPLPPEVHFRAGIGIELGGIDVNVVIGRDWWCFVDTGRLVEPDVARWVRPVGRNVTLVHETHIAVNTRVERGRIVNEGVERTLIERQIRRSIPVRKIVEAPSVPLKAGKLVGNDLRVFRPEIRDVKPDVTPPRARRGEAPGQQRREAAPAPPPAVREAERTWDRRWNEDWQKLQKVQKRDESPATPEKAAPPPRKVLEQHREENYQAAENASREREAARERAKRAAERAAEAPKTEKKQEDSKKKEAPRKAKKRGR